MSARGRVILVVALCLGSTSSCTVVHDADLEHTIISMERTALDRWGKGDPGGFLEMYWREITYFGPSLERRLDGLEALHEHCTPMRGKLKVERYEMINPKVQVRGNTAVLTFNLIDHTAGADGTTSVETWNCTEVYMIIDGEWRIAHSHWSQARSRPPSE